MACECSNCGKPICTGDDYIVTSITKDSRFCSEKCLKEALLENYQEEVIDDWKSEKAEWYGEEPSDPYDRYGVSRSDFF